MNLFVLGNFTGAAGQTLEWKTECDAFCTDDWRCLAAVAGPRLPPFSDVWGVPKGGLILAAELVKYAVKRNVIGLPPLIVDDVWTTGKSMSEFAARALGLGPRDWNGFVVFARNQIPDHVRAYWRYAL